MLEQNKKIDKKLGDMFVELIDLYQALIAVSYRTNEPTEKVDEALVKIIDIYLKDNKDIYDYSLETIPLAKENTVHKWIYNNIIMYKKPMLEYLEKEK